jgi:hypothetical protein
MGMRILQIVLVVLALYLLWSILSSASKEPYPCSPFGAMCPT